MTATRDHILSALRAGLAAAPLAAPAPPERPASLPVGADAWERLAEVLEPLETRLRLAQSPAEALRHVADIAAERQAKSYLRWDAGLEGFGPGGGDLDAALNGLTRLESSASCRCADLAQADLGIVQAQALLLDSGSLVLAAGPGRSRAASLLPPVSVVLVAKSAILPDVSQLPALLEAQRDAQGRLPACVNLVTGPSSTADIELVLVRGVHGPGALEIIGLDWD